VGALAWAVCECVGLGGAQFKLVQQVHDIPERGEVTGYVIVLETNRFAFVPPPQWSARADADTQVVTLQKEDLSATITIKLRPWPASGPSETTPEQARELASTRFPDAEFVRQFRCYGGDGPGWAVDLVRVNLRRMRSAIRLVWLPLTQASAEVQLTTSADDLARYHVEFASLLASLRTESAEARVPGRPALP
jgi:hypothetical protein